MVSMFARFFYQENYKSNEKVVVLLFILSAVRMTTVSFKKVFSKDVTIHSYSVPVSLTDPV